MQYTNITDTAGREYKITPDGTAYHIDTPDNLVEILERIRQQQTRVVVDYGDTATGKSWGEIHDTTGRIGRSTGRIKIPLLIYSSRSWGGGALLDNCIVGIKHANQNNGGQLYRIKEVA